MRPASRRPSFSGWNVIGEYDLSNGRTFRVIWLPTTQTNCNIVVWEIGDDPIPMRTIENVNRLQAAGLTEDLLALIESVP
jgi:hypothetical protein